MKPKLTLDLHGIKHQDVELMLENFFLWENNIVKQTVQIISGNSTDMKRIVCKWLDSNEFSYYIPSNNLGTIYVNG
jgi:DNA-nicking Smr family endonuclease